MSDLFIHQTAIVETKEIGKSTRIWAFVHILHGAKIGNNVNICDHCFIESNVLVGNNVTIKSGVYLWDGLVLEDNVFIGPDAVFTNDLFPRSKNKNYLQTKTILKQGCSIGANATVLAGCSIGEYSMVGAGAVVTKPVPDFALVYGNPAVVNGYICICGKEIVFQGNFFACECGQHYTIKNARVKIIKK